MPRLFSPGNRRFDRDVCHANISLPHEACTHVIFFLGEEIAYCVSDHNRVVWCSGAISGALAAFITNPLDVAKTRIQTQCTSRLSLVASPPSGLDMGVKVKVPTPKVRQIDGLHMRVCERGGSGQ